MRKNISLALIFLSAISFSLMLFTSGSARAESRISDIDVSGNQRIESSTVKAYLGLDVGDIYTDQLKNEAIKNLYSTSLFEDIAISYSAGKLVVKVKETPLISKVVFTGNSKIKQSILASEVMTVAGESLKKSKLASDVEKIKEIYKRSGRFNVGVNAKVENQENNRAKVVFEIAEGPKTGIKKIVFIGNNNYRDSELKSLILTKETRWFRFLETNDTYDPERIETDKYLLKRFYSSVGYPEFRIISLSADLDKTKDGFVLIYSIDEGDKYNFGKVSLVNKISNINDSEISSFIGNYAGSIFNMSKMQNLADRIADHLASQGYPQVDVSPEISVNKSDLTVDVVILVEEARRVYINKINIEGNVKTQDNVVRREFNIAEGDLFSRAKIERGQQNIRNLDYFEKLNLNLSPTKLADQYDIDIDVEEKSTASIGLDLGYSSAGGAFGRVSFVERNLIGTGRYLNVGSQVSRKSTSYNLGVTDPNFLDKDLSLGTNVFRSHSGNRSGFENGEQNYAITSTGLELTLGYDITEDLSHEIDYLIKEEKLRSSGASSSISIKEQMGRYITSAIGHSLSYDRLDSRVLPKNGYILTLSQQYAGLGGDTGFLKNEIDSRAYTSFFNNKYTLKLGASAGLIKGAGGKKVRISERFNLGEYSLRGFEMGGVGPRDKSTKEGLGGQKYYTMTSELNFPLGLPEEFNITGALFVDAGALWDVDTKDSQTAQGIYNDKAMRSSWGFGFIWNTRIAPIRLDWAFPMQKKSYDDTRNFHIKFSTQM